MACSAVCARFGSVDNYVRVCMTADIAELEALPWQRLKVKTNPGPTDNKHLLVFVEALSQSHRPKF